MEWAIDPTVWLGLATLVLLEIVLGIDNLVFIAILSTRFPPAPAQCGKTTRPRPGAFVTIASSSGCVLADDAYEFAFRAARPRLLRPRFDSPRWRTVLLLKATVEIHERLEVDALEHRGVVVHTGFGAAVAQIVVLDAIFSIDSILTAVGMTDRFAVMVAAVLSPGDYVSGRASR